ncbi:MAG: gyrase subunit, partial [Nocardioidaceae bacterium]|nr:gyrase subunit [Nocardioidaceae bacterium]
MATSNHHWLLFFTTAGRVYRTKAYNLPEASRDAKGGHVAGLLSFLPDERIAQVLAIRDYDQAPYLVLATRAGLVKKTRLGDYNSPRQAGVIAINFRDDDDELIGAELCGPGDDILLISRKGQSIRFRADDGQLRPMGRATSGVKGMDFRGPDSLLSMSVIRPQAEDDSTPQQYVFTITDGGFAKRSRIEEYRLQSRGGLGIKTMKQDDDRGTLVGGFIVVDGDEVLAIKQSGQVTRSAIDDNLRATSRDTKGVKFVGVSSGDAVAVVARSVESALENDLDATAPVADELVEDALPGGSTDLAMGSDDTIDEDPGETVLDEQTDGVPDELLDRLDDADPEEP